jgi:hypothetical protein
MKVLRPTPYRKEKKKLDEVSYLLIHIRAAFGGVVEARGTT